MPSPFPLGGSYHAKQLGGAEPMSATTKRGEKLVYKFRSLGPALEWRINRGAINFVEAVA